MGFPRTLDVKYHSQDTVDYCGAASAMMVLGYVNRGQPLKQQDRLYAWMHDQNTDWDVAPAALAAGLAEFAPNARAKFRVPACGDLAALTTLVVRALMHPQAIPPVVLIDNCSHYVVVRGIETDVEPTPGTAFSIDRILIDDPQIVLGGGAVHLHTANDACRPGALTYLTWAGWKRRVSQCNMLTSFVGVFSDRLAAVGTLRPAVVPTWSFRQRPMDEQDRLLNPDDAADAALFAVSRYMLVDREQLNADEQQGDAGEAQCTVSDVQLVQRIDRTDQYYYLVSLSLPATPLGTLQIDAWDGELLSFSPEPSGESVARSFDQVLQELPGRRLDTSDGVPALRLYEGTFWIAPTLVWRPCRESSSPYRPFRQLVVGGRVLYLDADGTIYSSLTDLRPGG